MVEHNSDPDFLQISLNPKMVYLSQYFHYYYYHYYYHPHFI